MPGPVASRFTIRVAVPGDEGAIFALIRELAAFERLEHQLLGSSERLGEELFGSRSSAEALVAEEADEVIGYALFFTTFSTFLTRPGIWLEDLFVTSRLRGQGVGRALMARVAEIASQRNAGRFEWSVLDWNERAIDFYRDLGAAVLPDWRICRMEGQAITQAVRSAKGEDS